MPEVAVCIRVLIDEFDEAICVVLPTLLVLADDVAGDVLSMPVAGSAPPAYELKPMDCILTDVIDSLLITGSPLDGLSRPGRVAN